MDNYNILKQNYKDVGLPTWLFIEDHCYYGFTVYLYCFNNWLKQKNLSISSIFLDAYELIDYFTLFLHDIKTKNITMENLINEKRTVGN